MAIPFVIFNNYRDNHRHYKEGKSLKELTDQEIIKSIRLPRHIVNELCNILDPQLQRATNRSHALTLDIQVLAALQLCASGSFSFFLVVTYIVCMLYSLFL